MIVEVMLCFNFTIEKMKERYLNKKRKESCGKEETLQYINCSVGARGLIFLHFLVINMQVS